MKAAVLFCHTDEQEPNAAVERELGRQYTQLSQYANAYGFELEQVFFHVGQLDYEHPDDVLLRFLRGLQNSRSNIVIAETRDYFPESQMRLLIIQKLNMILLFQSKPAMRFKPTVRMNFNKRGLSPK